MKSNLEELTKIAGVPVFHLQEGVYFFRIRQGSDDKIHILIAVNDKPDSPIIREIVTDIDGFASAIASLSIKGEDYYTWQVAKAALGA